MSDGIWYKGKLLGSVHYFVYREGQLLGQDRDIYIRLNDPNSLEILVQLSPRDKLKVGEENMSYEAFRRNILTRARDVHFDSSSVNEPARAGVAEFNPVHSEEY